MITLLTLYLGLVVGPHHFESAVGEDAPRLEIFLGGERLSDVLGSSITFEADFGEVSVSRQSGSHPLR